MIFTDLKYWEIRIQRVDSSYAKLNSVVPSRFMHKDNLQGFPPIGPTILVEWEE